MTLLVARWGEYTPIADAGRVADADATLLEGRAGRAKALELNPVATAVLPRVELYMLVGAKSSLNMSANVTDA